MLDDTLEIFRIKEVDGVIVEIVKAVKTREKWIKDPKRKGYRYVAGQVGFLQYKLIKEK